jgi:uncharacterized protein (DUF302 family)
MKGERTFMHLLCVCLVGTVMNGVANAVDTNLKTTASRYSAAETIDRIEKAVVDKGMRIFARIDHGEEAKKAGLEMKPTILLIFGNPKGGTPLMVAQPTAAIDLPMKALIWEDQDGKVWLTYNTATLLSRRHGVPDDLVSKIEPVEGLLEATVK